MDIKANSVDELVGRLEVLSVCGQVAKLLKIRFLLETYGGIESLKWWEQPNSPLLKNPPHSDFSRLVPARKKSIVVLTGAGISAESGIKTFRDSHGLWENHRIEDVASPEGFRRNPKLVQEFYNLRRAQLLELTMQPNLAHLALADFEAMWPGDFLLITQNVDNLHERAGSQNLVHMHGELQKVRCLHSGEVFQWLNNIEAETICPCCQKLNALRPHIVWFGEVPLALEKIERELERCDLFISIGTSGVVYPAAGFKDLIPPSALSVEVNLETSRAKNDFDLLRLGAATLAVPELTKDILSCVN